MARNRALIDGDKRLALAALLAFYGCNGRRLTLTNDAAYELVMSVATGQLDTVDDIAAVLQYATQARG
jgi:death on curing protein